MRRVRDDVLVLGRQEGAELNDILLKRPLDVVFLVDKPGVLLDGADGRRMMGDKGTLLLQHKRLIEAFLDLPHDRPDIVGGDGHLEVGALGVVAARPREGDVGVEAVEPLKAVADARGQLVLGAPRGDEALDAVVPQLDERGLGRCRKLVRLEAQQCAVDVEKRGLDHALLPCRR